MVGVPGRTRREGEDSKGGWRGARRARKSRREGEGRVREQAVDAGKTKEARRRRRANEGGSGRRASRGSESVREKRRESKQGR